MNCHNYEIPGYALEEFMNEHNCSIALIGLYEQDSWET